MNTITLKQADQLFQPRRETCVSLYMPVSWEAGQWRQNQTRLHKLLHEAETLLTGRGLTASAIQSILGPARQLATEQEIWQPGHEGLALFLTREEALRLPLQARTPDRVLVESRFLVTPLIPWIQEIEAFYLLAVSRNQVRLFHSDGVSLEEVSVPRLPASLAEACGHHPAEPIRQVHGAAPRGKAGAVSVFHGQGNAKDHTRTDLARFAHLIQDAVQGVLQEQPQPLLFAGVDDLFAIYSDVNTYPRLLDDHLAGNPETDSPQALLGKARPILAAAKRRQIAGAVDACLSSSAEMGAQSLREILPAAHAGMVECLVIKEETLGWGFFDPDGPMIRLVESRQEGTEDMVNRAVLETLLHRGAVYSATPAQLGNRSVAARYRFAMPVQTPQLIQA